MPHDTHTRILTNQDIAIIGAASALEARRAYIDMTEDWVDPFPKPTLEIDRKTGVTVVREDLVDGKARAGSFLVQSVRADTLVYVAPRYGHAGIALAKLAKRYDKKLVLFMPACKEISAAQAAAIELGAIPIFARIAAMPNLNALAKTWAESQKNAVFIPLGLRHKLVTAVIVRTAHECLPRDTDHMWCAVSTGVLARALQIARPEAVMHGVAVSRNIQAGERGNMELFSHPRAFAQDAKTLPDFPCASNYDAKAYEVMSPFESATNVFWNVAGDVAPSTDKLYEIPSNAAWHDPIIHNKASIKPYLK